MKSALLYSAVFAVLACQGCATIVSSTSKDVTFISEPPGAKVMIESKKPGRFYQAVTPQTVKLSKKASYYATYSLDGYHTATQSVDRGVGKAAAGSAGGNLLLIGILAPIGMGIDAASGAAATLPDQISNVMVAVDQPAPPNAGDAAVWRQKEEEAKKQQRQENLEKAKKEREGK